MEINTSPPELGVAGRLIGINVADRPARETSAHARSSQNAGRGFRLGNRARNSARDRRQCLPGEPAGRPLLRTGAAGARSVGPSLGRAGAAVLRPSRRRRRRSIVAHGRGDGPLAALPPVARHARALADGAGEGLFRLARPPLAVARQAAAALAQGRAQDGAPGSSPGALRRPRRARRALHLAVAAGQALRRPGMAAVALQRHVPDVPAAAAVVVQRRDRGARSIGAP